MNPNAPEISIVICFRDWGVDRLRAAVRSHYLNADIAGISLEVIVSDYGSADPESVRSALNDTPCRVVYTDATGPWNRSASLNAGVVEAKSSWIITTDADIVFTPATLTCLLEQISCAPDALYLIQCRDLPEGYRAEQITKMLDSGSWVESIDSAFSVAKIRPRWGMGGFAAFSSEAYSILNGYEERMKVWGGEDNDFATRMRRAGIPLRWLSRKGVGILHIWHEPSQKVAVQTEEGKQAIETNRRILRTDQSFVRNLSLARASKSTQQPLVTIIVPTYKRPELLRQCILSCINQTFNSWQLLVVENGDSTGAEQVVESFSDPRVKYLRCEKKGAAAARNYGLDHAIGRYVVIQDDDDVMVTTRLEDHLEAMRGGSCGSYSGWIDFDGQDFSLRAVHPGKEFSYESVLCNGKVLTHGALMLDRRVFSRFRYFEELSAGIDYGFILLLARNGLTLRHTGAYGILRRIHGENMTTVNSVAQKSAAIQMAGILKSDISAEDYKALRSRGLQAQLLDCRNEDRALQELRQLKAATGMPSDVMIDAGFSGSTLSEVIANKSDLTRLMSQALKEGRSVKIDYSRVSSVSAAYIKLLWVSAKLGLVRGR